VKRKMGKKAGTLRQQEGRESTREEIAAGLGISCEKIRETMAGASVVMSLDQPVGEGDTKFGSLVADERAIDPEEAVMKEDEARWQSENIAAVLN
jgi:DNA-directed RNA polymerase sigma subunit (sigma70/sigma32)